MRIVFAIIFPMFLLIACNGDRSQDTHAAHDHASGESYTCPMHPQVVQDKPGSCPVCGMALVKVSKPDSASNDLMLTESQVRLANISTQRITKKPIGQEVVLNGKFVVNEQQTEAISSRAAGRVEKLYIKETGQAIRKGQPLYVLYSEALLTLQREYLLAKEQVAALGNTDRRYKSFVEAAERKLLLYGLTKKQIDALQDQKSLQPRITFVSPASGIVTEINVSEGQYVNEGGALYKIEDISSLWVEAELYPDETSLVRTGDKIRVRVNDEEPVTATVTFLSPEYRANTQIVTMRASVSNEGLKFKPGQQAQVYLTHSSRTALAVPVDAVIRDGKGTHVYVQRGHNTFRPKRVSTGLENFEMVEIIEGLVEGDTVAVSGAYLLYSEIILKKGADPMARHSH